MNNLSHDSFDSSIELIATKEAYTIHNIFDALDQRMSDAREELETKEQSVLTALRKMKRQLLVLQDKRNKIEQEEIPYYAFQLKQAQSETEQSASQTLLVEKIRLAKNKSIDIETKIKWMHARIRKLSKSPNLVRFYLGDLQAEMVIVQNAIKVNDYLAANAIRFGDLRANDIERMFYQLRTKGEL